MKKILDNDIINNILENKAYKNNYEKSIFIFRILNNINLYYVITQFLGVLKTNIGIANITIPYIILKDLLEVCFDEHKIHKKLVLNRKSLKGTIKKLELEGISIDYTDLMNAKLFKTSVEDDSTIIKITDNNGDIILLEQKVVKTKSGEKKYEVYLLDENDHIEFPEKYFNVNTLELKELEETIRNRKRSKKTRALLKLASINIVLALSQVVSTSYNISNNTSNTEKIESYYYDKNSLNEDELDILLTDIEKEALKATKDDMFNLDNVKTEEEKDNYLLLNAIKDNYHANKEEKEIMYNFLEFFNDNPYLDRKKTYLNLAFLHFDRNYNPISSGKDNKDGTVTLATYSNGTISYYTNPKSTSIAHEVVHAIFDTKTIPMAYVEGFAKIIENEYFQEEEIDYGVYNKNVAITKITIELIGIDKFLEAMSLDNINIIQDALKDVYINNNSKATQYSATSKVNNLFFIIKNGLNDSSDNQELIILLSAFYNNSNYDMDKVIRINNYIDVLSYSNYDLMVPYQYFNTDKGKTLVKD